MTGAIGTPLVVDTSVAVKWFFHEPRSDQAVAILEACRAGAQELLVPDLIYAEFGNAVRKRVLRDGLAPEDGAVIVAAFRRLPFEAVVASRTLWPAAYRLALEYGCTVYDAVFIMAASQMGADCVTADEELYRAVSEHVPSLRCLGET